MINYSKTIVMYDIYLEFAVPYLLDPTNVSRFGFSIEFTGNITARKNIWSTDMPKYLDPRTYGKLSIARVNANYKSDKSFYDSLIQSLKNNPAIVLTEDDYLILDIHKDATTKTKKKKPTAEAGVIFKAAHTLDNDYKAIDMANIESNAKPAGTSRVKIYLLVQAADAPPPTIDKLVLEMSSGTMAFDIPFTEDQIGMIAYVAVCFSNDAGDGPMSVIIASPII